MIYLAVLLLVPVGFYKMPSGLPFDLQLDRIVAFSIFLLWLASLLVNPKMKLAKSPVHSAVLAFAGIVFLSFALNMQELTESARFADAVKRLFYVIVLALLFYFAASTIRSNEQIDAVIKFSISIVVIISLFCMVEFLTSFNVFRHLHEVFPFLIPSAEKIGNVMHRGGHIRVTGSADHPIALGVLLALFLPLALHYFEFAKRPGERAKYGLSLAIISLAMLMTVSRTPIVAIVAMLGVYYLYKPANALKFGIILLLVAFIVHMAFPGVLGGLRTFFSPSFLSKKEISNPYGRVADHPKMMSFFMERPLYGRGYGWWDNDALFYVDNQYLKILVELGTLGILALGWLFYRSAKEIWTAAANAPPKDKDLLIAILSSCIAYMVTLVTYDSFGYAQVTYLFFIILALGVSLASRIQNRYPVTDRLSGG
ncbi:MAG: O-antigen ligase family protein [Actinobacteria bacterium]|nr:O-antigen ligase family protein [Actinomycetota bacterium]